MSRRLVITCAGAVLGLGLALSAGQAAPASPGQLKGATNGAETLVDQVHGRHRYCARWPGRGWWHRHVGRNFRPASCGPRRGARYRHCFRRRGELVCVWRWR